MAETKHEPKEKDINQIVRYLTSTLNRATAQLERPFRSKKTGPNETYIIQSEFAHLLNEVMQGPRCLLQRNIAECNDFLDQVIQELARLNDKDQA